MAELLFWPALFAYGEAAFAYFRETRAPGVRYAAEEEMARVRRDHLARPLVVVERQRIRPLALDPEVVVDALAKGRRRREPVGGAVHLERLRELRHRDQRRVPVPLHLHRRDRRLREPAVGVEDRVPGVFPALVRQAVLRPPLVLEVAVTVAVPVALHPVDGRARVRPEVADQLEVIRDACIGSEQHAEERRRIEAAVVAAEGHLARRRHLAVACLVDDLAGLLVARRIDLRALK